MLRLRAWPVVTSKAVRRAMMKLKPGTPSIHLLADDTR